MPYNKYKIFLNGNAKKPKMSKRIQNMILNLEKIKLMTYIYIYFYHFKDVPFPSQFKFNVTLM